MENRYAVRVERAGVFFFDSLGDANEGNETGSELVEEVWSGPRGVCDRGQSEQGGSYILARR